MIKDAIFSLVRTHLYVLFAQTDREQRLSAAVSWQYILHVGADVTSEHSLSPPIPTRRFPCTHILIAVEKSKG